METKTQQLMEHIELNNTPFVISGNEDDGYFLRFGKYQLTPKLQTKDDVENYLYDKQWEITTALILGLINETKGKQIQFKNEDDLPF